MEVEWKFFIAGYLSYLRPCPAAGHLVTAFLLRKGREPVRRETTYGSSIEFVGYRMPQHEHKASINKYLSGFLDKISASRVRVAKTMRSVLRKHSMKADSIEELGLPPCNTRKNFRGASPFKYECLTNREVNMSYTKWFPTKIGHCYLSIEQCKVAPSSYMYT